MKNKVKELRIKIDGLAQLTKNLREPAPLGQYNPGTFNSDQIEKATDSLFLAKAWLGKVLGALGTESPYPKDGTRKTIEDIEPTADTSLPIELKVQINETKPIGSSVRDMNHIEKVDWLRQEISNVVNEADILLSQTGRVYHFGWNVNQHLSEARFWLGFELERIRKNDD